jgi:hypothetical protein
MTVHIYVFVISVENNRRLICKPCAHSSAELSFPNVVEFGLHSYDVESTQIKIELEIFELP